MNRLDRSQWVILALPLIVILSFLLIASGWQIHQWGINWIWGIFILILLGWRWLLVKWTKPLTEQLEGILADVNQDLTLEAGNAPLKPEILQQAQAVLQQQISKSEGDAPVWEDWQTFWQRCQDLVIDIAHIYYPDVKYPLLNIYIPQAYGLIRGTVDDMDRLMQKMAPMLNQVTIAQAYQGYEVYRKFEPATRKLWQIWNWGQWLLNPVAAATRTASLGSIQKANQELLGNLNQILRETALKNLCRQAIALYGETALPAMDAIEKPPQLPSAQSQTLKTILEEAEDFDKIEVKPLKLLLVGRTGAGKSSLINTLFQRDKAEVNFLPNTDQIQTYHWQVPTGESLTLYDTPGYEQINQAQYRQQVLDSATEVDLILLLTPALDPTLQMDLDFLKAIKTEEPDLTVITIVTQVDRLRPLREWDPHYNWQTGTQKKEIAIREAVQYRQESLKDNCDLVLPLVTYEQQSDRKSWGDDTLATSLVQQLEPSKQNRLARFLRNREARILGAEAIIEQYATQMTTTAGLTSLLKSPILKFISTLTTGSPSLAYLLAEQIPIEQLPFVIGRLQMAYELSNLLNPDTFDLLSLWSILLEKPEATKKNAWAFGQALVEYWSKGLTVTELRQRFHFYLKVEGMKSSG